MATYSEFRAMHKCSRYWLPVKSMHNGLPSATDPTQDLPIKNLVLGANGLPINCRTIPSYYTNAGVESLTSIERRNNDKFDVVGELQATEQRGQNIVKQLKSIQNEK